MGIMVFLPTLCRKHNVPYAFIKGKARLGRLVHTKTATCVALTDVRKEDLTDFDNLQNNFNANYNNNLALRRTWGGGIMGIKNQHMMDKREKLRNRNCKESQHVKKIALPIEKIQKWTRTSNFQNHQVFATFCFSNSWTFLIKKP